MGAIKTVGQERGRPRPRVADRFLIAVEEGVRAPVISAFLPEIF
jgi:hypothetical protein